MLTFKQLQEEHRIWVEKNFPDSPNYHSLLGVVEEVGELSHAHLKREQGIRGTEQEHIEEAKDAIGDTIIYLTDYCTRMGFDFQEIMEDTWNQVKQRDWQKNPKKGTT